LVKWHGYPDSDNTWEPAAQVHAPDLIKEYQKQHHSSIKALWTMVEARCALSPKQSQSSQNHSLLTQLPSNSPPSNSNPVSSLGSSSSCGSTTSHPTTP
jgi:hypothetical protein